MNLTIVCKIKVYFLGSSMIIGFSTNNRNDEEIKHEGDT